MVLVIVSYDVLRAGMIPPELQDFISPSSWAEIIVALTDADNETNCTACAIEACICVCFAFPCIFLCHPCISSVMANSKRSEKLNRLNATLFDGRRVLSITEDLGIIVNTEFITSSGFAYTSPVTVSPLNSKEQNDEEHHRHHNHHNHHNHSHTEVNAVAVGNPIVVRTMAVVVPSNAVGGSILTVQSPEGQTVAVTVPANALPGQELLVQY